MSGVRWHEDPREPGSTRHLPNYPDHGRRFAATGEDAVATVGKAIPGGDLFALASDHLDAHGESGATAWAQAKEVAADQRAWGWVEAQRRALVERVLRHVDVPPEADRDEIAAQLLCDTISARMPWSGCARHRLGTTDRCDLHRLVHRLGRDHPYPRQDVAQPLMPGR